MIKVSALRTVFNIIAGGDTLFILYSFFFIIYSFSGSA